MSSEDFRLVREGLGQFAQAGERTAALDALARIEARLREAETARNREPAWAKLVAERDRLAAEVEDLKRANREAEEEFLREMRTAKDLRAEVERLKGLSVWGTSEPVGPKYDEIENLRAQLDATTRERDVYGAAQDDRARLRARVAKLEEALRYYGAHGPACMAGYDKPREDFTKPPEPRGPCDCGLSAVLAKDEEAGT